MLVREWLDPELKVPPAPCIWSARGLNALKELILCILMLLGFLSGMVTSILLSKCTMCVDGLWAEQVIPQLPVTVHAKSWELAREGVQSGTLH